MKQINFFDGYNSETTPVIEPIETSIYSNFSSDESYEDYYGSAEKGMVYFNTTDNLIHYYNGSSWVTLNDHDSLLNKGTVSHQNLDTHYNNSAVHFEMLNEPNFISNSSTKTVTQQSAKTYIDSKTSGFLNVNYGSNISAGYAVSIGSGPSVSVVNSTATGFMGITQSTGTAGNSYNVATIGKISSAHSGGIPGNIAYIQTDGSISTSVTSYKAGRYISETEILVTPNP